MCAGVLSRPFPPTPSLTQSAPSFVAFPSSVIASSLNCYIVRAPEIDTGIPLQTQEGAPVPGPPSSIAAAQGKKYR